MAFWSTFILVAVALVASFGLYLLSPKPKAQTRKPSELDDFDFPTAREGSPVPLIWGKNKIKGPNNIFYGGFEVEKLKRKVKSGLFSSKSVTVGYNYRLTIQICLGIGIDMLIHKIWFGDRIFWDEALNKKTAYYVGPGERPAPATATNPPQSNFPNSGEYDNPIIIPDDDWEKAPWNEFYGKKGQGGWVWGFLRFQDGRINQRDNAFLRALVGEEKSVNYRGYNVVTFEEFYFGESTTPQPIYFEVATYPNALGLGQIGEDCNPMEIIWDIFTNSWGGLGEPASTFDKQSFIDAGEILRTEGIGLSMVLSRPVEAGELIREIMEVIDGVLVTGHTGLVEVQLIREIADTSSLPVLDESNIIKFLELNQADWSSTLNQIRVTYLDNENEYEEKTVMVMDHANITVQQKLVSAEYKYHSIKNKDVAHKVASRELRLLSVPLISCRVQTHWGGALPPGAAVVLNWPDYNLVNGVFRVQKTDYGTIEDAKGTVSLIQDAYSAFDNIFTSAPPSDFAEDLNLCTDPHMGTPFTCE